LSKTIPTKILKPLLIVELNVLLGKLAKKIEVNFETIFTDRRVATHVGRKFLSKTTY
jgi:hypothetical protein